MSRRPEIGNIQLYPDRPLKKSDKNGFVLKFYCPIRRKRIRKNCGTRDRREARRILRECRQRLLNGLYQRTAGAITAEHTVTSQPSQFSPQGGENVDRSWQECLERYLRYHKNRVRKSTQNDAISGLHIAERILENHRHDHGFPEGFTVKQAMTLDMLDWLQDQLLSGEECRYARRSPHTVNSVMAVVMTFVRYCCDRGWIDKVPNVQKLETDEVMKGRPVTPKEFELMLDAVPSVVGPTSASSWTFALKVLWESGFRIGDLMDFHHEDDRHIHPIWPTRKGDHPTIAIPSTQKNGKVQQIPMLPCLRDLLLSIPEEDRIGWVVNPAPREYAISGGNTWFRPSKKELARLVLQYSNCAIAQACCVSDTTVRKWLARDGVKRPERAIRTGNRLSPKEVQELQTNEKRRKTRRAKRSDGRLTETHVGRVISKIGESAGIIVQQEDERLGKRVKYASAHDLRRGCAERLINMGVSGETLKVIFRHSSFSTTEKFYGASRSAQAAAKEVAEKFKSPDATELVGGLVGGVQPPLSLNAVELAKLKSLLNAL